MDERDFMKAFAGVDLLQTEAVAKAIGFTVAKLREGMIEGGMTEFAADNLICMIVSTFVTAIESMYKP